MKKYRPTLLLLLILCGHGANAQSLWSPVREAAQKSALPQSVKQGLVYKLDEPAMKAMAFSFQASPTEGQTIELPLPDGTMKTFKVWAGNLLPPALAAKYPGIRTFTAEAVGEPAITAKLDWTEYGFHALVFNGGNTALIDPTGDGSTATYVVRYKKDEYRAPADRMQCLAPGHGQVGDAVSAAWKQAGKIVNGYQLRTYRLALTCNHQYAQKVTGAKMPTKAQVLSKMATTMNRVNGIYERELSVTMAFVATEDTLIFNDSTRDAFGAINDNPTALIGLNQVYCDSFVGNANYDIGHVFSTNDGGLSQVAVVCSKGSKAQSVTGSKSPMGDGFDVDYVAHEMGHEFGSDHTFNNSTNGSCAGNADPLYAYEPGSGSTIMAYAGICRPDDLQPHSDAYFCASSLQQIYTFITAAGNTCPVKTGTANKPVSMPDFSYFYTIPFLTPFELEAPAAGDSVSSSALTYCWEQADLGDFGRSLPNTSAHGPLFRSFYPDASPLRVFPKMNKVFGAILDDSGNENAEGEKIPNVARTLNFKLTLRNIYNGHGCFLYPDDSIHLDVINTGRGFTVTSQGREGILYLGQSVQSVTWDVAQTTAAPINASRVDIYMTADSGRTWPYFLGNFPNNGSAIVTLPNPPTTIEKARIKVKGSGNVFFNVNRNDFAVLNYPDSLGEIKIFPIPAHHELNIVTGNKGTVQAVIFDVAGRKMWRGEVDGIATLDVAYWPRAMYLIKLIDVRGHTTVKKIVLD